jgi:hypothetical protein
MSDKKNTPPHPEGELKFQMQAMTQMMERMNFVMGNVCDRLDRVEKRGNEAGTSTQDMRKLGAEPKANSGNRAKRPRWADYEDFKEDADDIGDGSFEDEAMSHREGFRQLRNRRDFGNRTRGQCDQRENFRSVGGHANLDGDLDAIKLKYLLFKVKMILRHIWSGRKRWIGFFIAITIRRRRK